MDLYTELVDRVLFPAWESGVRRRPTLRLRRHLEQTERLPLADLEAIQLGALRRLLAHAYAHVPFYRARLDAAGLRPEDVRTLADYRRLPVVERLALREAGDLRASTAPPLVAIRKTTSGSTGEPLVIGYDMGSEHWRQATKLRGYGWAGYRIGASALHYWGTGPAATGLRAAKIKTDRALRRERWVDCNARGDRELLALAREICRDAPEFLIAFSQAAADLARFVLARGIRCPEMTVLCAAERLLPQDREAIVSAFGPRVFETYGSREVMLMASECEAHDGMHVSMENLLLEIVVRDGDRERPAEPGETGEVVVTDLHNYGMPFLRYASGDMAVNRGPAPCRCGRSLPRIGPVEGRVTETLVDAEGGRVSGLLLIVAMVYRGGALRGFQVVQHRDRSVTMRVVGDALPPELERELRGIIEPRLRGLPLRIELVDELPLDRSGKRRQVIVER